MIIVSFCFIVLLETVNILWKYYSKFKLLFQLLQSSRHAAEGSHSVQYHRNTNMTTVEYLYVTWIDNSGKHNYSILGIVEFWKFTNVATNLPLDILCHFNFPLLSSQIKENLLFIAIEDMTRMY